MDRNYDTTYASVDEGTAWPWLEVQLANKGFVQDVRIVIDHYRRIENINYCGGSLKNAEVRVVPGTLQLCKRSY